MKNTISVHRYSSLLAAVRGAFKRGRARAERAVEREKVTTAWEIGKLIDTHILKNKARATYDTQVIEKLAHDLGKSRSELYFMLEFARTYPIVFPGRQLSWSHYKVLLGVNNKKRRKMFARDADEKKWGRDRLRDEIKKYSKAGSRASNIPVDALPTAQPGTIGVYRIIKAKKGKYNGEFVIDLGFSTHVSLREVRKKKGRFTQNDIVSTQGRMLRKDNYRGEADLFTYNADVIKVIDGDTIKAVIDLGFGVETEQTLRFKEIDTPEIDCAAGRRAKNALRRKLSKKKIIVRTKKSDKYDRYLVDIFLGKVYINAWLVEKGYAKSLA